MKFKIGDKVLHKRYSLHKDDCLTIVAVLTETDMKEILPSDYVFTGQVCYYLREIMDLIDEEDLTLYEG